MLSLSNAVDFLIEQARKAGADAAESFGVHSLTLSAECRLQKRKIWNMRKRRALICAFLRQKPAVVSSSVLDKKTLGELAQRAVQMAKAVPEDPFCGLADPERQATDFPDLDLYDPAEQTTADLLELALKTEDAALSVPGVTQSDGAGAGVEKSHVIMASSTGFRREYDRSSASVSVSVIAADADGKKETDYDYSSAVYFSDLENGEKSEKTRGSAPSGV